ncbi:MAG: transcription-repair coupling factor [Chloroflexota bacterium]|nr:MAG: transcription-repair coupling factor [Chloroflexota bacterium]
MDLTKLLAVATHLPQFILLLDQLRSTRGWHRAVVLEEAKAYVIAAMAASLRCPVVVVTARADRARQMAEELAIWSGAEDQVCLFPEPDGRPFERIVSDLSTTQQRLRVLGRLLDRSPDGASQPLLIVASVHALTQRTLSPAEYERHRVTLRQGQRVVLDQIAAAWVAAGYSAAPVVDTPGTFSRRGGILDIYPATGTLPARIELFDDEIDGIRLFEPATQRSVSFASSVEVGPCREILPGVLRGSAADVLSGLDFSATAPDLRDKLTEQLERVTRGQAMEDYDTFAGFFVHSSLLDYLPKNVVLVLDEPDANSSQALELDRQSVELRQQLEARGELPVGLPSPYHRWEELSKQFRQYPTLELSYSDDWLEEAQSIELPFAPTRPYGSRLKEFVADAIEQKALGRSVVVVSHQARRLSSLFSAQGLIAPPVPALSNAPVPGQLVLVQGAGLSGGWLTAPDSTASGDSAQSEASGGLVLFTDAEVFGFVKAQRVQRQSRPRASADWLSQLSEGDYVVHIDHGIGRFNGMTRMTMDGVEREYLQLEYADRDRLYVPVDQVDRVSRYVGGSEAPPSVTRLGTSEWDRAKGRATRAVAEVAKDLLEIHAARESAPGISFAPDSTWQVEMESSFPYVETPDQLAAVEAVKKDMETERPMDRLICGDVGYGKTEVALRAAFKAVMSGKQVAVLVPTTILAQQHFSTFSERLASFPIRVEMLCRFRSEKEQRDVLAGLQAGSVDICIGTHRLLQKDVAFKDLGLVIVDEEQRFGVMHKEHLKRMRQEVDVLTLTATPIPRTLHLALAGARDMCTMETPPEERLPIKTYVAEYDDQLVRGAILRELDRGGQVYFVHNRVHNIWQMAKSLEQLVPEARFTVAHGQMPEEKLESVMSEFVSGSADVLVCTTIIESGLDIPNANTLIVNQADRFGLTQLYQLRGRIGRGANRAYAYLLVNRGKTLTETAQKRLRTIHEANQLGAGFRVAMKDLEIRGAGNLLGVEQSGQIAAVGFDLYSRLLAAAVQRLKQLREGSSLPPVSVQAPPPTIDLPLPAYLPESYVSDLSTRLDLYRRLASAVRPDEVEDLTQELRDRFGPLPGEAEDLIFVANCRVLAASADVRSVQLEENQVVIRLGYQLSGLIRPDQRYGPAVRFGKTQIRLDRHRSGQRWKRLLLTILQDQLTEKTESPAPQQAAAR